MYVYGWNVARISVGQSVYLHTGAIISPLGRYHQAILVSFCRCIFTSVDFWINYIKPNSSLSPWINAYNNINDQPKTIDSLAFALGACVALIFKRNIKICKFNIVYSEPPKNPPKQIKSCIEIYITRIIPKKIQMRNATIARELC